MEELTSKGKYKVNVGNHLHTNMISKQATGEQRRVQMQAIRKAFEIKMSATNNTDYTQTAKSKHQGNCKSKIYNKLKTKGLQTTLKLFIKLSEENKRGKEGKKDLQK